MKEIWKTIEDYPNYQVSNLGRVKSLAREWIVGIGNKRFHDEMILKLHNKKRGYKDVCLFKNGKRKYYFVHRLVAQAFILNPENKPEPNHIDGNPSNNKVNNLEWVTKSENRLHAIHTGLAIITKGEDCSWSKLTEAQVRRIKWIAKYCKPKNRSGYWQKLAKSLNVSDSIISMIVHNKRWKEIEV